MKRGKERKGNKNNIYIYNIFYYNLTKKSIIHFINIYKILLTIINNLLYKMYIHFSF
ncbi:hypothetical protein LY90DRAFT_162122 [Neocallimastix californiae]|uniref:Uncharacterized protein n=1 Tax=Neocallimastix californiae TaxID=1754190 RepID=A0A1Y2ACN2_9FUNG|nr:hypothetical protein LY90DRAFT_162122 [Neocallimastix californiae]|eukprot:ORY20037.1 hypothetical protein LY90DRAFT_162122 [Neocallimastix californiae]